MLTKLTLFLNEKHKRFQLNRALDQVAKHLETIERSKLEFEKLCSEMRSRPHFVTDQQMNELRERFGEASEYLENNEMFALNPDMEYLFRVERDAITQLDGYPKTLATFEALRLSFKAAALDDLGDEINKVVAQYEQAIVEFFNQLNDLKAHYVPQSKVQLQQSEYQHIYEYFNGEALGPPISDFLYIYRNLGTNVRAWNDQFISKGLIEHKVFLDNIDGKSLDKQQRIAVLTDDNMLVLAGAGSGKTLTIAGKVKFLVEIQHVNPKDILLLSFTNNAAREMHQRINERLSVEVDVFTFHKLGMSIIASAEKSKPDIADIDVFLKQYMKNTVYDDKKELQKLIDFFGCYINVPKDVRSFDCLGDYYDHTRNIDFETIKGKVSQATYTKVQSERLGRNLQTVAGESVKSLEEVMIANFLFLHGVDYEYERPYEHDTRDDGHAQYKPDFYLPKYGIYIEHFGVNEYMKAPWLSEAEEAKYIEGILWKRTLHRENETTLIQSFSYYNQQGVLLEKLEQNLLAHGVQFQEIDYKLIFEAVSEQSNNYLADFMRIIGTYIGLFKSNGYGASKFDVLHEMNRTSKQNRFLKDRAELFLELTEPIYHSYQAWLRNQKAIDFNDMINFATEIVESEQTRLNYKYIIIDEYQDISQSRFKLINTIQNQTAAKVMCVGDDWQSIFRFAGSDVELFTRFGNYFGPHELLRIEQTYRNSQELIDIAGTFVMKNPRQYRKDLKSGKRLPRPVRVIGYQQNIIDAAETAIREIVSEFGASTEVMLIGRNNFDIQVLDKSPKFSQQYNRATDRYEIRYEPFPRLTLFFLTAHRSKGREADHVIILNAANSQLGFPNKIADDPVLSWVLTNGDNYEFAEERRLFYVALTRTRNRTYILAPDRRKSLFAKELIEEQGIPYQLVAGVESAAENPTCPKCKTGRLVIRTNQDGRFLGCTNFPMCDEILRNVEIMLKPIVCPECGGYLVLRKGKFGAFFGCTNFPWCDHKEQVNTVKF